MNYIYKYKIGLLFLFLVTICFFFQNQAVPFFADDYKWIGGWQLRHEGIWQDICQIVQTQWEFCHVENGRLFCHAMVQVLVSWGETFFDCSNTIIFFISIWAVVLMSFSSQNRKTILPWLLVVVFFRYLIAEDTTLLYWACGSMNYLLPTGMLAVVIVFLRHVENKENVKVWWYLPAFIFSLLSGWQHEIIVLPVSFALFVFTCINFRKLNSLQWVVIFGYCIGALLVLLAPANFHRINGPIGMVQENWISTIAKRIYMVIRFGYVFDILCLYILYLIIRYKKQAVDFFKQHYFWFSALVSVFAMGMVLGTSSRMRWGIDIFSLFIVLSVVDKILFQNGNKKVLRYGFLAISFLIVFHQCLLIKPFYDSWQTYRDAEQQCYVSKCELARVMDWHSENWITDCFVAHPYHLLKEDDAVFLPNGVWPCKAEVYDYISSMSDEEFHNMPKSGMLISGEYIMPEYDENLMNVVLSLAPMSLSMDAGFMYLLQHIITQKVNPHTYPAIIEPSEDIIHKVECNGHKFICFDKPFIPVWRDIVDAKLTLK